jgi:hypothetical protein
MGQCGRALSVGTVSPCYDINPAVGELPNQSLGYSKDYFSLKMRMWLS